MWDVVTNSVVTHLFCLGLGGALAWYATHKSMLAALKATVDKDAASVAAVVKQL
jgi:hypothetical protein